MRHSRRATRERPWLTTGRRAATVLAAAGLTAGVLATSWPGAQARPQRAQAHQAPARNTQLAQAAALAVGRAQPLVGGPNYHAQVRRGRFLGIIPARNKRQAITPALTPATANGTPPLLYHKGPVQHSSKIYAIFWQPPGYLFPTSYRSTIARYFTDVANSSFKTSNVYAAATQYYDRTGPGGSKNWVSYDVTFGGSVVATNPTPASRCPNYRMGDGVLSRACLTDAQLKAEIRSVIAAQGWPKGLGDEFFLFTPKHLADCFDTVLADGCDDPYAGTSTSYCAYHSYFGTTILYALQPWEDQTGGCVFSAPHSPTPNGNGADVAIYTVSHEQNETMTDPLGNGWWDKSGEENGDECIWLPMTTHYNGTGDYSQIISGDEYLLQYEWSNRAGRCVAANRYAQPTGSFAFVSSGGTHGESFTATVSDSDDTSFSYEWRFGDGASTLGTSPNAIHTYATAGTYTVTLVIFDAHGDQVRVTNNSVVVS